MDLHSIYKAFCRDTKRNGGVLVGKSIRELLDYIQERIPPDVIAIRNPCKYCHKTHNDYTCDEHIKYLKTLK